MATKLFWTVLSYQTAESSVVRGSEIATSQGDRHTWGQAETILGDNTGSLGGVEHVDLRGKEQLPIDDD